MGNKMNPTGQDIVEHAPRDRWNHNLLFLTASVGSAIGLGNFWKFGYFTFKHGGGWFIAAYLVALFTCGVPMLILELTLGQKM
jgi:NSS family neurotransmitter:Na+ symporter